MAGKIVGQVQKSYLKGNSKMAKKKEKSNGFLSIFDVIDRLSCAWLCPAEKKCCEGVKCQNIKKKSKKKVKKKAKKK